MRARLVEQVRGLLSHAGFAVSEVFQHRPISFDFLARRDDQLYILKVLTNIDSLSEDVSREMRVLARFLDGRPLLVGLKSSSGRLEAGAVYVRHGIPILSFQGLKEYLLDGAPPVAFAAPGGFCVQLDGDRLEAIRHEENLSLGQLADVAGVSRRAISMYEAGMSATVEAALRLEEYLEEELIVPLDPFSRVDQDDQETQTPDWRQVDDPFTRAVFELLAGKGLGIIPTSRSPFSGIGLLHPSQPAPAPHDDALLLNALRDEDRSEDREMVLRSVSSITERTAVYIVGQDMETPPGAAVLRRREVKRIEDPEALAELVKSKKSDDE